MGFRDRAIAARDEERKYRAEQGQETLQTEAQWAKREAARTFGEEPQESVVLSPDEQGWILPTGQLIRFGGYVLFDDVKLYWTRPFNESFEFWVEMAQCPHCFSNKRRRVKSLAEIADALEVDPYDNADCGCMDGKYQRAQGEKLRE